MHPCNKLAQDLLLSPSCLLLLASIGKLEFVAIIWPVSLELEEEAFSASQLTSVGLGPHQNAK